MDSVGAGIVLNFANMPSLKALTRAAQANGDQASARGDFKKHSDKTTYYISCFMNFRYLTGTWKSCINDLYLDNS